LEDVYLRYVTLTTAGSTTSAGDENRRKVNMTGRNLLSYPVLICFALRRGAGAKIDGAQQA
jgi:hypothetical protein